MIFLEGNPITLTPSIGEAQTTLVSFYRKEIIKILVEATTASTTFDFQLIDKNNIVIYERTGEVGKFVDNNPMEHVYGNFTVKILNSSVDEAFNVLIVFKEITY